MFAYKIVLEPPLNSFGVTSKIDCLQSHYLFGQMKIQYHSPMPAVMMIGTGKIANKIKNESQRIHKID